MISEVDTLKELIEEQHSELEYYKKQNLELVREKDQLRVAVETFVERNVTVEGPMAQSGRNNRRANQHTDHSSQKDDSQIIIESLGQVEYEKKQLRVIAFSLTG